MFERSKNTNSYFISYISVDIHILESWRWRSGIRKSLDDSDTTPRNFRTPNLGKS